MKEAEDLRFATRGKSPIEEGSRRPEPRQGVGDSKKRVQLAGLRAQREVGREDARHLLANFPASVRRACELTLISAVDVSISAQHQSRRATENTFG